jgi:hypothetical protein
MRKADGIVKDSCVVGNTTVLVRALKARTRNTFLDTEEGETT